VSPNGQISGFTEYAGREVLVILPGSETPVVRRDAAEVLGEAEALVRERMELAFREYKNLRSRFPTPDAAAKSFLAHLPDVDVRGLLRRADTWLREQTGRDEPAPKRRGGRRPKG
jgi:hypothetical protein